MVLTRAKFKAWLARQPASEVVGKAKGRITCPLANYLADAGGSVFVVEDGEWFEHPWMRPDDHRGRVHHPLPKWAGQFVDAVDKRRSDAGITVAECLALLNAKVDSGG